MTADELTVDMSNLYQSSRIINSFVKRNKLNDEVIRLVTDNCDQMDAIMAKDIVKDSGIDLTEFVESVARARAFIA
jgi:hypothetical protein